MRKLLLTLSLVLVTVSSAQAVEIESDAIIQEDLARSTVDALADTIRAYDYRCDWISSVQTFIFGRGFTVNCNNWTYTYEVEDKGGRIEVRVK